MSPSNEVEAMGLSPMCGTFVFMMLYGMTVTQIYYYFNSGQEHDGRWMKILVGYILIAETAHAAVACHYILWYFINHYGQPPTLLEIPWSVPGSIALGFAVAWPVNMFFVRKIFILSKRQWWLAILICSLATLRPGFAYTACVLMVIYPTWGTFFEHGKFTVLGGLSAGLTADTLICFSVSFYLLKGRKRAIKSTRNIINTLLKYTINSGGILFLFAILELMSAVMMPNTLTFLGAFQIQVQLYANCFLTNLNAREDLRRDLSAIISLSECQRATTSRNQPPGVKIQSETYITVDPNSTDQVDRKPLGLRLDLEDLKVEVSDKADLPVVL